MTRVVLIFMIFVLCEGIFAAKHESVLNGEKLPVVHGDPDCISNCSFENNYDTNVQCTVEDCGTLPLDGDAPEKPDITNVYFEIFKNEAGEKKLALNVQWSPSDDSTLERITGYLVEISHPSNSYTKCYNISTEQDFAKNTKDIYYNDCFGKEPGTEILFDQTITVSITALPQWNFSLLDSRTVNQVLVPNCSYPQFWNLTACNFNKACTTDCSTSSVGIYDEEVYPIKCSISKPNPVNQLSGPEYCVDVNRTTSGTPSAPHLINHGWYKYGDAETGEIKLALNFTWSPRDDASISSLVGYYMEVLPTSKSDLTGYNKCFSIHDDLEEEKHSLAEFYYDCYGQDDVSSVEPQHTYHIHINSLPRSPTNNDYLNFAIEIPSCAHEDMQEVTQCVRENNMKLKGDVMEIFCANRSIKYWYHVSQDYGTSATVGFCERGDPESIMMCKNTLILEQDLITENVLYNLSLDSAADLSINYSIYVSGNDYPSRRHYDFPDFSSCIEETPEKGETYVIVVAAAVLGILILVVLTFLLCLVYKRQCNRSKWMKILQCCMGESGKEQARYTASNGHLPVPDPMVNPAPTTPPEPIQQAKNPRIFVISMDDHELHTSVVYSFCCYLKTDLGLDVHSTMWNKNEAAANPVIYMNTNLKKADKVIVICSAGTRDCLNKPEFDGNMFAPAVRQIVQKAFVGENPGKYLVVYFEYSSAEDVPELLRDQTTMYCSLFKLMKQFEQFYFRLIDTEQFQEGVIQRMRKIAFDEYYDPSLTKHGPMLRNYIAKMTEFVSRNPTWYTDKQGSDIPGSNLPPMPIPARQQTSAPSMAAYEEPASINLIHLSHPPEIPVTRFTASRQKAMNTSMSDQRPRINGNGAPIEQATRPKRVSDFSVVSRDTEESFMVPADEVEQLSLNSSQFHARPVQKTGFINPANGNTRTSPTQHSMPSLQENYADTSFQPESFDYTDEDTSLSIAPSEGPNSSLLTNLPSNETQITRIGYPNDTAMAVLQEVDNLMVLGADAGNGTESTPPESGVFTLANLDDFDGDFENEFKSINMGV